MGSSKDDAARVRVCLAPGIQLRGLEERGVQVVLVCPEGNVQLNSMAAAILDLCDGTRDRERIVVEVVRSTRNRARPVEVMGFLEAAVERGWIREAAPS